MRITYFFSFIFFFLALCSSVVRGQYLTTQEQAYQQKLSRAIELFQNQNIVNSYLYLKEIYTQFENEAKDNIAKQDNQQLKEYLDIILGLSFNNNHYKNKALAYISTIKNKALTDKLIFAICVYFFLNKEYKTCIEYTKDLSYENFNNQQTLYLKFIQAYSYFETLDFKKAFVLFDFLRQVSSNNPFYADSYYYYSYLQLKINNNLKLALNGFYLIEGDKKYANICPYYISNLLYALNYKLNTQKYLEEKFADSLQNYIGKKEMNDLLTKLYFESNSYAKIINRLRNEKERNEEQNFYLGVSYFKLDSFNQAIEVLNQVHNMGDTVNFEINFILAQAYLDKKNPVKAQQYLSYCMSSPIKSVFQDLILFLYAKTSLDLGRNSKAFQTFQQLLANYPTSKYIPEAKQLLIISYANNNNFKEAIKLLNSTTKFSDKKVLSKIYFGRAMDFFISNKTDSLRYFLSLNLSLALDDNYSKQANLILGDMEYQNKKYDNAIHYFQAALGNKSNTQNNTNIQYQIAYCYFKKENYSKAIESFNQVLQSNEEEDIQQKKDATLRLGDAYYMSKKYADANAIYAEYANDVNNPNRDYALYQNAMIAGINNPLDKIELMNTIVLMFPNTPLQKSILLEVGNTELAANKFEDAIKTFTQLLVWKNVPGIEALALLNIGLCYNNLNNEKKAVQYLKQVVDAYPKTSEADQALLLLQELYSNKGDVETFIDIAKQNGQYTEENKMDSLYFTTAEIKYREKNFVDASTLFTNYLAKFPNGIRKNEAQFFLFNIAVFKGNRPLAHQLGDSLLKMPNNKFLEKIIPLLLQLKDSTEANKWLQFKYNTLWYANTKNVNNKIVALKNILLLCFELQRWEEGYDYASALLQETKLSEQEVALIDYFYAKKDIRDSLYAKAIEKYTKIIQKKNTAIAPYAAYDNALLYAQTQDFIKAEKQAFYVIENYSQYGELILKSYLLLADIYYRQKDFFNAKETLKSIIKNSSFPRYKEEASQKLTEIEEAEKALKATSGVPATP